MTPPAQGKVGLRRGERIVFVGEPAPQRYANTAGSGDINETLLDAPTDYVQRKRLNILPRVAVPQLIQNEIK
jgi:hypothetical protein